jgi:putative peptide zinc metalloprotease protein
MAIIGNLYSMAFMLNPVFKFDGYWVLADSLGIHGLSERPRKVLLDVVKRLIGREYTSMRHGFSPIDYGLLVYSIVSVIVWGWFTWRLIPFVMSRSYHIVNHGILVLEKMKSGHVVSAGSAISLLYSIVLLVVAILTSRMIVLSGLSFVKDVMKFEVRAKMISGDSSQS